MSLLSTRRNLALAPAALVLTLAVAAAAFAGTTRAVAEPGVTPTTVLVGGTVPLTGPASAYASVARGAEAYLAHVNASGGVHGRRISYAYLDDAGNPSLTVQATKRLVEQNQVFAIFNALGTEQSLAVREYLNVHEVPQVFVASGATAFGADAARYPWTMGFQPSYQAEGWVLGKYVARTRGAARIAVLFEDDDYGKDLLNGLKRGLQRSRAKVVAAQPYSVGATDVQAQMARLRSSGAETLAIFASARFAVQAYAAAARLGWKPKLTLVNAAAAGSSVMRQAAASAGKLVDGSVSIAFLKDPTDPARQKDAAIKLYRQVMKQYAPGADPDDVYHVYGMAAAWSLVAALERAGRDLTRDGLMKVVRSMSFAGNPFLLPGIALRTGPGDAFPIEQMLLQRWQKDAWRSFGGLWGYRA